MLLTKLNFHQRWAAVFLTTLLTVASACDDRTAEEKGRDYAEKKVGFAEGAAEVLEKKGKALGESVGKGVGDLVKGAGSAVKDVVHPPVTVKLAPELIETGINVLQSHEGKDGGDARNVIAYLDFPNKFHGRLQLRAFDADGKELARSATTANIDQAAASNHNITFAFPGGTRLSKVDHCMLHAVDAKHVTANLPALKVSQLREVGSQVSVYVIFEKRFRGGLQLRASNAGDEIGRSEPSAKISHDADSATHLTFSFHTNTPLDQVAVYTLHEAKPKLGR